MSEPAERPTYYSTQYYTPETKEMQPGVSGVYEYRRNEEPRFLFRLVNRGDVFQELLKRGIPTDDARNLVYEIRDRGPADG